MPDLSQSFLEALRLIGTGDGALVGTVTLSLQISGLAVLVACALGIPLGALLAVGRFRGRGALCVLVGASLALPPVVVGLGLYLLLSQAGPLSVLGLLYTPAALVIAQTVLVTPIIAEITRQAVADLNEEHSETLRALRASRAQTMGTLLWEARPALLTAVLAGLGRALAEVGAVMIVGGNIEAATRVMTTAIATEAPGGDLALAIALGLVLLVLSVTISAMLYSLRTRLDQAAGRALG